MSDQPRCKKCGKPLSDPVSIARGMGPECAGLSVGGRSFSSRGPGSSGSAYSSIGIGHTTMPLFTWAEGELEQGHIPERLVSFPADLLDLVLSAPVAGVIAMHVKHHRRSWTKEKGQSPMTTLREIRRTCIELRMLFWPGFFSKGEALACIPCGDNGWKLGEDGKEISTDDLLTYLKQYGVI